MVNGCHHICLRVKTHEEFAAVREFYCNAFGCAVAHSWGEGEGEMALLDFGGSYVELGMKGQESPVNAGWLHVALRSSDVDADVAKANACGAVTTVAPKIVQLGPNLPARIAFVRGLGGEEIELFQEL